MRRRPPASGIRRRGAWATLPFRPLVRWMAARGVGRPWADTPRAFGAATILITVPAVLVASGLWIALDPRLGERSAFYLLLPASLVATLGGGARAGLLVANLGAGLTTALVLRLRGALSPSDIAEVLMFCLSAGLLVLIANGAARTRRQAEAALDDARRSRDACAARAEALAESGRRYRSLMDLCPDALVIDAGDRIVYANAAMARLFGTDVRDLLGRPPLDLAHPGSRALIKGRIERIHSGDASAALIEGRWVRTDGSVIDVEATAAPADWQGGAAVLLALRDVTPRTRVITELQAHERLLRAVMSAVQDAIIVIDDRGVIGFFNDTAERIFGYTAAEAIGRNVSMLMPSPYREEHDGYLARYLSNGERRVIGTRRTLTGQRKDGSAFHMELTVGEVHRDGQTLFTGIVRDLTGQQTRDRR